MTRAQASAPALCRGGRSSFQWREQRREELPLPRSERFAEFWARVWDCPSTGHGFRGERTPSGAFVCRVDWLSSKPVQAHFRGELLDFGPFSKWRQARALSELLLCHFHRSRWIEPILRDEFARRIVRALPHDWRLSDEALAAWINGFHARRVRDMGATFVSTSDGPKVWPPNAVTSPRRAAFRGMMPLQPPDPNE